MLNLALKLSRRLRVSFWAGVTRLWLRGLGVRYGRGLRCGYPPIIFLNRRASLVLGENVTLSGSTLENAVCQSNSLILAANATGAVLRIGNHSGISCGLIYASKFVEIGNYVNIGADCAIYDTDFHPMDAAQRRTHSLEAAVSSPVIIEDDVWLGARVTVLKGVRIGRGTVVAAGAVVSNDLPPFVLAGGVPARVIKFLPTSS